MKVKTVRISKTPKYVICTNFRNELINYMIDKLDTLNNYCDVGVWKIIYK